jgi:hypothetical protein
MAWTLAVLGAGAVAYGVTKGVSNKRNSESNQEEKRTYYSDVPEIY